DIFKNRKKMNHNGAVLVTLLMDQKGNFKDEPVISSLGIFEDDPATYVDLIKSMLLTDIKALDGKSRENDAVIIETTKTAVRRALKNAEDKKPLVSVHVIRK